VNSLPTYPKKKRKKRSLPTDNSTHFLAKGPSAEHCVWASHSRFYVARLCASFISFKFQYPFLQRKLQIPITIFYRIYHFNILFVLYKNYILLNYIQITNFNYIPSKDFPILLSLWYILVNCGKLPFCWAFDYFVQYAHICGVFGTTD
jgi:hypothetical protein